MTKTTPKHENHSVRTSPFCESKAGGLCKITLTLVFDYNLYKLFKRKYVTIPSAK